MSGSAAATGSKADKPGMGQSFYDWLQSTAAELIAEVTPLRTELIGQMEAALKGDVSGGMIPILSKAVESAKQAASRTQQATTSELARTGLTGTPFGAAILGQTKQQGEQAGATAETNILQQLLSAIPNYVLGQTTLGTSGVAGAGQRATSESFGTSGGGGAGKSK